jgi:uncharacterized protein (DUF2141 family)
MVRILVFIVIYVFSELGYAQAVETDKIDDLKKETHSVTVEINNIRSDEGKVYFALYDSESNFNSKNAVKSLEAVIINGSLQVIFEDLEPKTYAVICFHDANSNGKMDFEENGMPLEDYGMTNNVMNFGPPQFDDAKFELINKDLSFEIIF